MKTASVYLLWLEGIDPDLLAKLPTFVKLQASSVDWHLAPLPLNERGQCYYQTLTGTGPGKFGRFDFVRPEAYTVCGDIETPEGSRNWLLPDILRARKLSVAFQELRSEEAFERALAEPQNQGLDFGLFRLDGAGAMEPEQLECLLERWFEINSSAHRGVLTDVWIPPAHAQVNVNDFLADIGLLEIRGPRSQNQIVWSETLAYGLGTGQIWINLRGREPQGIVSAGQEYQDVCNVIRRELSSGWLDPWMNETIVAQVFKKDEIYAGEYLFKAPDLVTMYRPGYVASAKAKALRLDGMSVYTIDQELERPSLLQRMPQARLLLSGPALVEAYSGEARLIDLVPNLLYLLGQPIPQRLDGQVNLPMFTPNYRQQTPLQRLEAEEDHLSDEEEGLIVDRLRDLGYLG